MDGLIQAKDLLVARLGPQEFEPSMRPGRMLVDEEDRIVAYSRLSIQRKYAAAGREVPSFELAGPRGRLFFNPREVTAAVVTCGGLCPGQNDVIRSIVLTGHYAYGLQKVLGFRYGYAGLGQHPAEEPVSFDARSVRDLHLYGGTVLASSRGTPEAAEMVDTLQRHGVDMLFTIGGDGTLRGASGIAKEIERRGLRIAVIGIPKTIDNDILWVDQSFGFRTAVEEARRSILAAHVEAQGAYNGVGLVKLMGRHSGFIAAHACLANPDVNFCLVPEVPFTLDGPRGFLASLQARLADRHHAVVVVAEGAGQDLLEDHGKTATDASGNAKLLDIGVFLKERILAHLKEVDVPTTVKYIDPSYIVRSLPAIASDSQLCLMLGQNAVHAAMAGRTDMMVGYWNQHFTHVPIEAAVAGRRQLEPNGNAWQAVLASTGQPANMF